MPSRKDRDKAMAISHMETDRESREVIAPVATDKEEIGQVDRDLVEIDRIREVRKIRRPQHQNSNNCLSSRIPITSRILDKVGTCFGIFIYSCRNLTLLSRIFSSSD